jgi:glycosyltransferase involved in cell wall biosynthesis
MQAVWITWENQVRNRSMSKRLGVDLFVVLSRRRRLFRYAICSVRTLAIIAKRKPSVVFVQNPSIVLTCLALAFRRILRYRVAIDAHLAGVVSPTGNRTMQKALDFCNRRADLVIVTNAAHQKHVESLGGRSMVCEDPLPDIAGFLHGNSEEEKGVFLICSFDVDEPFIEVLKASQLLEREGFRLSVSGNFRKAGIEPSSWPLVTFTGFIPEHEFYSRLAKSQVVVDLTTQENCLVCGAYEAMAMKKPLVTSNTAALREFFNAGSIFVEHDAPSIAAGIQAAYTRRFELNHDIEKWAAEVTEDNLKKSAAIRRHLEQDVSHRPERGAA